VIYKHEEAQWFDIDGKTEELKRKTCPITSLSTTDPTWTDIDANPGLW
jgi:hypothetical protein